LIAPHTHLSRKDLSIIALVALIAGCICPLPSAGIGQITVSISTRQPRMIHVTKFINNSDTISDSTEIYAYFDDLRQFKMWSTQGLFLVDILDNSDLQVICLAYGLDGQISDTILNETASNVRIGDYVHWAIYDSSVVRMYK
jgi:hypothetical protein